MKMTPKQAAPPHMILLDSNDLIGCVLRHPSWKTGWIAIEGASHESVDIAPSGCCERTISLATLRWGGWQYHLIGDLDDEGKPVWNRCEKEAAQ